MIRVFKERDANLLHLQDCQIAVIGYGNLGRPLAMNLRDSGVQGMIGNVEDAYATEARHNQFNVVSISDAVSACNIIYMALPDEVMSRIFLEQVAPFLKMGDLLLFGSGYNIVFKYIEPPVFVDVGLIAPRTIATNIRQAYLSGRGYPAFIALHQRATTHAADRLLAVALAMGALRRGALETTFQQEVELDLFYQQAILPAMHAMLLTASQVLVEAGYPPEAALTELFLSGELGDFLSLAAQQGFRQTLDGMALTGRYGVLSRTQRFQESKIQLQMESILETIKRGDFALEWADEFVDGYPRLLRIRDKLEQTTMWRLEQAVLDAINED